MMAKLKEGQYLARRGAPVEQQCGCARGPAFRELILGNGGRAGGKGGLFQRRRCDRKQQPAARLARTKVNNKLFLE